MNNFAFILYIFFMISLKNVDYLFFHCKCGAMNICTKFGQNKIMQLFAITIINRRKVEKSRRCLQNVNSYNIIQFRTFISKTKINNKDIIKQIKEHIILYLKETKILKRGNTLKHTE